MQGDNEKLILNGTPTDTPSIVSKTLIQPIKLNTDDRITISANNIVGIGDGTNYVSLRFGGISNGVYNDNIFDIVCTSASAKKTFTVTNTTVITKVFVRGNANITFNNFTLKPQLELDSTATTYEPHQGKELPLDLPVENLFDEVWEQGTISNTTGENSSGSNVRRSVNYIPVLPETTYVFNRTIAGNTMPIREYGANKQFIGNKSPFDGRISSLSQTFTTSSDVYFIRLVDFVNNSNNKVMIEQGSKANAYTPYGTDPIELCKIGDYQDYFYKSGSKWYLHKEIGKVVLNGSEGWKLSNNLFVINALSANRHLAISKVISNLYQYITSISEIDTKNYGIRTGNVEFVQIKDVDITSVENLKTFLSTNNLVVYYILQTATNTEITDTTLISQLEAIYNAPLYEQTNITQENNDLPMVLDITACKDNINGIKAFIRK